MDLTSVQSFGAIDAEGDILLRQCFQGHAAYVAVRNFERFLVLGRKGAGKTAIHKQLVYENQLNTFTLGYSFEDYPWSHHDLQSKQGVPEERRYTHSWRYLMLMGIAKILLNSEKSIPEDQSRFEALGVIESFVVDSYGSRDPDFAQLFSPKRELRFSGSLKLALLEISGEAMPLADLPVHIQDVNKAIQTHILTALSPENEYFLSFDQLDLGFHPTDLQYGHRLVGLILAARDLVLSARDTGKRLNVVVFLRDDIYQDLHFEDKNKITQNYATYVRWNEGGSSLTLKSLMERRFMELANVGHDVPWDEVFDETKEMPSRQTKYNHICDRTFLRPRDMIQFCNESLAAAKDHREQPSQIKNADIQAARSTYSAYLLNELDDEIRKHVPNYQDYLEVLKSIGAEKFQVSEFESAWSEMYPNEREDDATKALNDLFEFSVIAYLKPGGRGGGSEYVWKYKDPSARFTKTASSYRVHPGFKEGLDLIKGSTTTLEATEAGDA